MSDVKSLQDEFNELAMLTRFVSVMNGKLDIYEGMSAQERMDYLMDIDIVDVGQDEEFSYHIYGANNMLLAGHVPACDSDLKDFNNALLYHLRSEDITYRHHLRHFKEAQLKQAVPQTSNNQKIADVAEKWDLKHIKRLAI